MMVYISESLCSCEDFETWEHYLVRNEFVLYSDHEALKFLNSQKGISNNMHVRWVTFLQRFPLKLVHKADAQNNMANALSQRTDLLYVLCREIVVLIA